MRLNKANPDRSLAERHVIMTHTLAHPEISDTKPPKAVEHGWCGYHCHVQANQVHIKWYAATSNLGLKHIGHASA